LHGATGIESANEQWKAKQWHVDVDQGAKGKQKRSHLTCEHMGATSNLGRNQMVVWGTTALYREIE